jgi:hypothetical protein
VKEKKVPERTKKTIEMWQETLVLLVVPKSAPVGLEYIARSTGLAELTCARVLLRLEAVGEVYNRQGWRRAVARGRLSARYKGASHDDA